MDNSASCFRHLVDNIPIWIQRIDEVAKQLVKRQADLADADAESKKRADSDTSSHERLPSPKRQRTEIKRARSGSSGTIGHKSSQSTRMVVVYYDPDFQQTMIELVREIGSARNSLRKARMASRFKATSTPSLMSDDGDDGGDLMAKLRLQRNMRSRGPNGPNAEKDIYEKTDSWLEKAQAMCETAAHQFLRDGASRAELDEAKTKLSDAHREAAIEVKKAEGEEARQAASTPDKPETTATAETSTAKPMVPSFPMTKNAISNLQPAVAAPLTTKRHDTTVEDVSHEVGVTRITDEIVSRHMDAAVTAATRDDIWDSQPMTVAPIS